MNYRKRSVLSFFPVVSLVLLAACHGGNGKGDKDGVKTPGRIDLHVAEDLKSVLQYAADNHDKLNDSTTLLYRALEDSLYSANGYIPVWSDKERWKRQADSLFAFIDSSKGYGLFPTDYHYYSLHFIQRILQEDTMAKKSTAIWTRADLLLTDAFFHLVSDLRHGRLDYDSVTLRKDSVLPDSMFTQALASSLQTNSISATLHELEPRHPGYDSVKAYLHDFLAAAHFRPLTWLDYPYKDSASFYQALTHRLQESGYIDSSVTTADTATLRGAIRQYQTVNKLKVSGKVTQDMVTMMNNSDWEKFKRIAITLDRYKQLPDTLPKTYVWVNLPSFTLDVVDSGAVALESKVIVGAPKTRTPLLTSEISNFVTYPQWTVPNSIIFHEMLPAIKHDVGYLQKQNLIVVDDNDSVRDPTTINWRRLNKNNFPYQLKQREGDDNSLGVMKFNFRNKYDVYLHDTNVRWMFDKLFRALSHGCVRVKEWRKLSDFLIRNDTMKYHPDTLKAWIARQEKHTVWGFSRVPIFIRYFTVEGKKGKLQFYDDIYGEDKTLRNRYFAQKPIS
ncbi:MAG TPA: L,D-transpeptidase family protein [Puia sp.]|jgi:murein L,D-transpeptidase YcbB/YkuD|nr:L,D-transpeptidase family protein [Puia sp.]